MGNKKSSFAPRDHSLEETKHSPIVQMKGTAETSGSNNNNIAMLTNISIDNGSSSLGSGRGFKLNNFNSTQSAGIKKSLGSNNKTGS
jgi:hypothetical protein